MSGRRWFLLPAGEKIAAADEGGELSEIRQRRPLIRPFGPPSPRRGEETSGGVAPHQAL